jgi:hypothetical protein
MMKLTHAFAMMAMAVPAAFGLASTVQAQGSAWPLAAIRAATG